MSDSGRSERVGSIASSCTEAGGMEEHNEKLARIGDDESLPDVNSPTTVYHESDHEGEDVELLPQLVKEDPPKSSLASSIVWMVVNTFATIGIVFVNKAIFSDPSLKLAQLTFAAFHFTITWFTLYILSRPRFAFFVPRRASIREIAPLSIAMSLNVILPNLSLAFSTVTFYQVARILLTPCVALMNYVLYRQTLPANAIVALLPACAGVGMVSYYDSLPAADASVKTTSGLGVVFAFTGIFASSLYTVWIASYHRKLQMSSMQLLFNQAPVSAFMLLYVIPFVDTFPVWSTSGGFASLINISQFFIIAQTGPVSSTVVGHVKTCSIVALGWATSGRAIGDKSVLGVFIAIGGIIAYSVVMLKEKKKQLGK
ncbi:Solute carrier family 35 member E3 [Cytospora mali]|uniref:GDP-mannose transporter n=1 Tax=Cytospora mali TaxID=578113 RepID=A0A194V8M5_CYTMA|nr:Solute carrier family 35 member E3 [Valsa mali var. pyri (nom. inval.)]